MKRLARVTCMAVVAWCFIVFAYGLYSYPDAPYKPCKAAPGYCGKTGLSHTELEYHAQKLWERALLISWPCGILAALCLRQIRKSTAAVKAK
jgi:hypothetical protein